MGQVNFEWVYFFGGRIGAVLAGAEKRGAKEKMQRGNIKWTGAEKKGGWGL